VGDACRSGRSSATILAPSTRSLIRSDLREDELTIVTLVTDDRRQDLLADLGERVFAPRRRGASEIRDTKESESTLDAKVDEDTIWFLAEDNSEHWRSNGPALLQGEPLILWERQKAPSRISLNLRLPAQDGLKLLARSHPLQDGIDHVLDLGPGSPEGPALHLGAARTDRVDLKRVNTPLFTTSATPDPSKVRQPADFLNDLDEWRHRRPTSTWGVTPFANRVPVAEQPGKKLVCRGPA